MFSSNNKSEKKPKPVSEAASTVIAPSVVIESATFKGEGTVRIDGHYIGEMDIKGNVIIGEKGRVQGNIKSIQILVAGHVEGNITCDEDIHFASSANVSGNLVASSFIVDEGANFNGNCTMSNSKRNILMPEDNGQPNSGPGGKKELPPLELKKKA